MKVYCIWFLIIFIGSRYGIFCFVLMLRPFRTRFLFLIEFALPVTMPHSHSYFYTQALCVCVCIVFYAIRRPLTQLHFSDDEPMTEFRLYVLRLIRLILDEHRLCAKQKYRIGNNTHTERLRVRLSVCAAHCSANSLRKKRALEIEQNRQ